jgi:hypothetical protein
MLKRLPRILIALALASSIGWHWAFLQAVAWAGMVISYSHQGPVADAVVKTFDGHHPCSLCKQIEKSKRTEKKANYNFEFGTLKFPYAPVAFIFTRPALFQKILSVDPDATLLTQAPPVPPPRILPG